MSLPKNITRAHLIRALEKIDQEGIPRGGQSRYYDAFFENGDKAYPPKLIISYANLFANGDILDRESFAGGMRSDCFRLLMENGFKITEKGTTMPPYKVKIYDIKSTPISTANAQRTFSPDGRFFFWNDAEFKTNDLGDYIFFVNKAAKSAVCTRIGEKAISATWNREKKESSFKHNNVQYSVQDSEGKYTSFNRFDILERIDIPDGWTWTRFLGQSQTYELLRPGLEGQVIRLSKLDDLEKLFRSSEALDVLEKCRSFINGSALSHIPEIERAIRSQEIQNLLLEEDFHFEYGQEQLRRFMEYASDKPEPFFNELVQVAKDTNRYDDLEAKLSTDPDQLELVRLAGGVVAYCDFNARNKKLINRYDPPRTLARAFVRQGDWMVNLFLLRQGKNDLQSIKSTSVRNAITYLLNPRTGFTMLSEDHRKALAEKLLRIQYNSETFISDVLLFFEPYGLDPVNPENLTWIISSVLYTSEVKKLWLPDRSEPHASSDESAVSIPYEHPYRREICAIRTKPFLLMAGISGTGKSRMVRTLAYKTCPGKLRTDHVPRNFKNISVRPNWHDSGDLLGYVTRINGNAYNVTEFIQFVLKAWHNTDTPFFLCLDEMNLAPVEQYFAEYLSKIESRRKTETQIITDTLISAEYVSTYKKDFQPYVQDEELMDEFQSNGIGIPSNLIVIGTVNMDETTHSFSRKVLDRAMTFEKNIDTPDGRLPMPGNTDNDWTYENSFPREWLLTTVLKPASIVDEFSEATKVVEYINKVNKVLEGTSFMVAYRTLDEAIMYMYHTSLCEGKPDDWFDQAFDDVLLMKVLPRVEGDENSVASPLKELITEFSRHTRFQAKAKQMQTRLEKTGYTSFWS